VGPSASSSDPRAPRPDPDLEVVEVARSGDGGDGGGGGRLIRRWGGGADLAPCQGKRGAPSHHEKGRGTIVSWGGRSRVTILIGSMAQLWLEVKH